MPAKSKSQQRLMGMVHTYKRGELDMSDMDSALIKKIKKIAGSIKTKDSEKFAKTKHKGLPEVKEHQQPTFKQYLIEMTLRDRKALVPPPAIQKLYAQIKAKYGIVKREVFYNQLADKLNLTPQGLKRLQQLPALRALPFDDQTQDEKPGATRRDPWSHVTQKNTRRREERTRSSGVRNW